MRMSIIIPAYNEELRIGSTLDAYGRFFQERLGGEMELLVVVNGSNDRTAEVTAGFMNEYPQIRVIEEPRKIGKGGAIMLGCRAARGDWIGFVDADGATPPDAFYDLYEARHQADVIIASRYLPASRVDPRQPWKRRAVSRLFNTLVRLMFRMRLSDTQCGAKLVRRQAIECIIDKLGLTRWAFDLDLLFQLHRKGFKIVELPTVWQDIEGSKLKIIRASAEMFVAMCRLRLLYSPFKWVVKLYDLTIGRWVGPK